MTHNMSVEVNKKKPVKIITSQKKLWKTNYQNRRTNW
jgi:hypothetical protein